MKWYCIRPRCLPADQVKDMLVPEKSGSAPEMDGVSELPDGFREATITCLEYINEVRKRGGGGGIYPAACSPDLRRCYGNKETTYQRDIISAQVPIPSAAPIVCHCGDGPFGSFLYGRVLVCSSSTGALDQARTYAAAVAVCASRSVDVGLGRGAESLFLRAHVCYRQRRDFLNRAGWRCWGLSASPAVSLARMRIMLVDRSLSVDSKVIVLTCLPHARRALTTAAP